MPLGLHVPNKLLTRIGKERFKATPTIDTTSCRRSCVFINHSNSKLVQNQAISTSRSSLVSLFGMNRASLVRESRIEHLHEFLLRQVELPVQLQSFGVVDGEAAAFHGGEDRAHLGHLAHVPADAVDAIPQA